jgi:glyoxylase I family protein
MSLGAINHIALTAVALERSVPLFRAYSSLSRLSAVEAPGRLCGMGGSVRLVHIARGAGGLKEPAARPLRARLHHLAFSAESREQVDAIHRDILLPLRATVLDPPQVWPQCSEGYHAVGTLPGPARLRSSAP